MREVTINGKSYKIEYGLNAVCSLEDVTHRTLDDIVDSLKKGVADIRLARAIFWAGLLANTRSMTLERAGEILDQADGEYCAVLGAACGELIDSFIMRIGSSRDDDKADEAKNAEGTA